MLVTKCLREPRRFSVTTSLCISTRWNPQQLQSVKPHPHGHLIPSSYTTSRKRRSKVRQLKMLIRSYSQLFAVIRSAHNLLDELIRSYSHLFAARPKKWIWVHLATETPIKLVKWQNQEAEMCNFQALCNEGGRVSTVQPSSAQESGPPQTAHLAAAAAARFFRRAHHQLFGELQIIARPYPHHHRGKLCKFWPGRTRTPPPWTSRATCSCC